MLSKGMWVRSGCSSLKSQKPGQLVERKVCLISDAGNMWRRVVDICPKADFPQPPADRQRVRAVIDRVRGGGAISEVILRVVISGLAGVISVISGTVFSPGCTCSISLWSVLGTGAVRVLGTVWSSLANSSTWGFSICKTAHTMWLRVWSVALEKELKVPDGAYWLLLFSLLRLFSFVVAFLTSLIKLILWRKFSTEKRQAGDTVGGQGSWSPALFQMEVKNCVSQGFSFPLKTVLFIVGAYTFVPWLLSFKRGRALEEKENKILVKETGYFFIYGQVGSTLNPPPLSNAPISCWLLTKFFGLFLRFYTPITPLPWDT